MQNEQEKPQIIQNNIKISLMALHNATITADTNIEASIFKRIIWYKPSVLIYVYHYLQYD